MLSSEDISEAHRFMNDLTGLNLKTGETGMYVFALQSAFVFSLNLNGLLLYSTAGFEHFCHETYANMVCFRICIWH